MASPKAIGYGINPSQLTKSPHGRFSVERKGNEVRFRYRFHDHQEQPVQLEWSVAAARIDALNDAYGVPSAIFEPFLASPEETARRNEMIRASGFRREGNTVRPDYRGLINAQRDLLSPVVAALEKKYPRLSETDRAQLYLNFCQDLPFGVPPNRVGDKFTGGLLPVSGILMNGWADCDSKSLLYATLASYIEAKEIRIVSTRDHQLVALKLPSKPGDRTVMVEGQPFVMAEPVGVGRLRVGQIGPGVVGELRVESL